MKTRKIILVLTGMIFLLVSCEDFLEEKGYNSDYTYFETATGLDALVASCYQQTRWSVGFETQYALEDLGSDIFMIGGDGTHRDGYGQYLSTQMSPLNTLINDFWKTNYKGIASCNLALRYVEDNTDMLETIKPIRKGEVLFLRAYYYYELAVQFGSLPLVVTPTEEPRTDFYRVPQNQVWNQIISDARQAWELLPWAESGMVTGDWGRASKGAAGHLLAKAYMFRYCDRFAKNQSDANMNEDRGGKDTDIDSVIYFASRVCNFGEGTGSGSDHALADDFSTLWGWDQTSGLVAEYTGTEILFSINFSTNNYYNNYNSTDLNSGGNWLHMFYTAQIENYPLNTSLESGDNVTWGNNIGLIRDFLTDRPWRRLSPTPYYYSNEGLYAARNYETGKLGKLVDSRLYKSHVWVLYCNSEDVDVPWAAYSNAAGSFDPADIGMTAGEQRYGVGDTAVLLSLENVSERFGSGTPNEKLALARAMEKYWYIPMQSIKVPTSRGEVSGYDVCTNQFPTLIKHLDSRRAAVQDQAAFKNFMRMRLAETYILLSEAYARKGDFSGAADALNVVRQRAAWKEGEEKNCQYWKYDGGTYDTRNSSTENDMAVSAGFLSAFSEKELTDFYLDEMGHETAGELNRFDLLVRYGSDYWKERVETNNYWTVGNIQTYHRFRPIPQPQIDPIYPADPNPQNYGYN
jgi:starch-binding outer membrane protein, SusD/RagB family